MIIKKDISKYVVGIDTSIKDALKFMAANSARTLFVVDESNILVGVLSSGDLNNWLSKYDKANLLTSIKNIINSDFVFANISEKHNDIKMKFTSKIDAIPILDTRHHLKYIAFNKKKDICINNFCISEKSPTFIIAEIGNNHNGSISLAKDLVDLSIQSNADCVKFQMRDLKSLYNNAGNNNDASEDLGSQYVLDLLAKFSLTNSELIEVFDYAKEKGILPLCTPWDLESLEVLENYGMSAYKISSADMTNVELLEAVANTHKPLIVSTGMATESEVKTIVKFLEDRAVESIFLHCNSTYPTPYKDINLNYLMTLKSITNGEVGYSGHERGIHIPIAAVSLGAKIIEKHFTIDKNMEGNDHKVSLLPTEFADMVKCIREVEISMGTSDNKTISQGELINRETLAKSIVAATNIKCGETIDKSMLKIQSPGNGLQPIYLNELVGTVAKKDYVKNDFFYKSDILGKKYKPKEFKFNLQWGIPVRFHDYLALIKHTNVDLLEYHLSYKDVEVNLDDYVTYHHDIELVVHSPELFQNDHILDLSSVNKEYLNKSIIELQNVVNKTLELKKYFPKTDRPCIVTNIGGFTKNSFISKNERVKLYNNIEKNLKLINSSGVEIIIQTMPPFPWHFGGQSYHNLFMDPDEIVDFCKRTNMRICLDVSHSYLACNYFKWNFDEFVIKVAPFVAHIHIVDAKGTDDEGIQIGTGDIDFKKLGNTLKKYCPNSSFIPEIWQGHKNGGEGFWEALSKLEKYNF